MADWQIKTSGFDSLQVKLSKFDARVLEPAMREALTVVAQEASRNPPQPSRTRSKHFNTWIRERGQYTIATFRTVRGDLRKRPNLRAGRLIRPSEMLLKKWKTAVPDIVMTANGITGKIVNKASYGEFVQGEKQAKFHAVTGWKTTSQILESKKQRIFNVFRAALLGGMGK